MFMQVQVKNENIIEKNHSVHSLKDNHNEKKKITIMIKYTYYQGKMLF